MIFDAIVLSGGRSQRLDGVSKATLAKDGSTLLDRALSASHGAREIVVVGEGPVPHGVRLTREQPAFGGPAAGVAAGRALLSVDAFTLVLACDMPNAAAAVARLIERPTQADGRIAVDEDGRDQYLLALYRSSALDRAIAAQPVDGLSMRSLVAELELERVAVPAGTSDDVDTWADADRLGLTTS